MMKKNNLLDCAQSQCYDVLAIKSSKLFSLVLLFSFANKLLFLSFVWYSFFQMTILSLPLEGLILDSPFLYYNNLQFIIACHPHICFLPLKATSAFCQHHHTTTILPPKNLHGVRSSLSNNVKYLICFIYLKKYYHSIYNVRNVRF